MKPNFPILDPKKPETWVNRPAPADVSGLQKRLDDAFGTIPDGFGDMSGKSLYKIVWGQSYKHFDRGRMRLAFDDDRIPARITVNHFAVTEAVYNRALEWFAKTENERFEAFKQGNLTRFGRLTDYAEYLEAKESNLNYFRLPEDADAKQILKLLPEGWRHLQGLRNYEETGVQAFIILKWQPPAKLGTEKEWAGYRFSNEYVPEADAKMFVDCLGAFPRHGAYSVFVRRIAKEIDAENYEYIEPSEENTVRFIEQRLFVARRKKEIARAAQINIPELNARIRAEQREQAEIQADEEFGKAFDDARPKEKRIFT